MRFVPALAICSLLAFCRALLAKSDPMQGWVKAVSPECIVYSDLPAKMATDIAARYTVFRRTFFDLLAPPRRVTPPAIVLVVDNEDFYTRFTDNRPNSSKPVQFTSRILFTQASLGTTPLLSLLYEGKDASLPLLYEFDVTFTLPRFGLYPRLWSAQGTGEVFASAKITDDQIEIGNLNSNVYDKFKTSIWLDWPVFFAVGRSSRLYTSDGTYLAQAWALMHTVLLGGHGPSMRERFLELDRALGTQRGTAEKLAQVIGVPPAVLQKAIAANIRATPSVSLPSHLPEIKAAIRTVPVDRVEVLAYASGIERALGYADQADLDLDAAYRAAPDNPIIDEAMAWRNLRQARNYGEAQRLFQKAMERGPTQAEDFMYSALIRMNDRGDAPGTGGVENDRSIAELRQAARMDPGNPEIYIHLGKAFSIAKTVSRAEADELLPGLGDDDQGLQVELARSSLLRRLGDDKEADASVHHVIATTDSESLKTFASDQIYRDRVEADAAKATALADEGKFGEAFALINAGDEAVPARVGGQIYDRLRGRVAQTKAAAEILALYQKKDYKGFINQATDYLTDYPKSPYAERMRKLLEDAQAQAHAAEAPAAPEGAQSPSQERR